MWDSGSNHGGNSGKNGGRNGLVAVAIDKERGSQHAIKWAIDNLLTKGQRVILIHVVANSSHKGATKGLIVSGSADLGSVEDHTKDLFLNFHCFCTRKDINCFDVVLEDKNIARTISEYVSNAAIENLVLGASRHGFLKKLKMTDIPSKISKGSPDFCTVYVISKSKISYVRNASRMAPFTSPLLPQLQQMQKGIGSKSFSSSSTPIPRHMSLPKGVERATSGKTTVADENKFFKSPFSSERGYNPSMVADISLLDTDISFVGSNRPSTDMSVDPVSGIFFDRVDSMPSSRDSMSSESSLGSWTKSCELNCSTDLSSSSESDDAEAEMRRLKIELQKTMQMYSTASKEAQTAKEKVSELHRWRMNEEKRLEAARFAEEAARMSAEQEKEKYKAALEDAYAAQRVLLEPHQGLDIEMSAPSEIEKRELSSMALKYRRYTIEEIEEETKYFSESRKIGEGDNGRVYKCHLDHTPVAVKVLHPDAFQGENQFDQEVEVLSSLRHPNMVLLLGACPEYGCLVYEYMLNGSLEDRLFKRGNTLPLSWQVRFKIAAETATVVHYLHQTRPEPMVHGDIKLANILLDQNYVSKISDVGLVRLIPPSKMDDITKLRLTSTTGASCHIDPEYQQTGLLGVKFDIYSFGIVLLQILTAKPAMGLAHAISNAIEHGTLLEVLDFSVPDWPLDAALCMAKLGLQCTQLMPKDRPDLGKVVLPELETLTELAKRSMPHFLGVNSSDFPPATPPSHPQLVHSSPHVASTYRRPNSFKTSASLPGYKI